jgi:hypothetical protein
MIGSDFDRPGLLPRANYNIGIGHTFGFLKKDPIGDELTFGYTYENAGTHGFLHTTYGEHTESAGVMKNFSLPKTKTVTGYTWLQSGITSYTGNIRVQNRLDSGVSLGAIVHFNNNNSIWLQESYSKVARLSRFPGTPHPASGIRIAGDDCRSLYDSLAGGSAAIYLSASLRVKTP